jgi:hypothetical protein
MKRILIGFTVLLLLSTAGYAVVTWRGRQESAAQLQPLASSLAVNERLVAEARVVPVQSAALSLPSGGIVAALLVREGDRVQAGQALLRLDRARRGSSRAGPCRDRASSGHLRKAASPRDAGRGCRHRAPAARGPGPAPPD